MQTTTVKLYSLEYTDAKTYLTAALFMAGNIVLPPRTAGRSTVVAYLFFYVDRSIQIRLEGRIADSGRFPSAQFHSLRNACCGGITGYFVQVGVIGIACWLGCHAFQKSFITFVCRSRGYLSDDRYIGRMGDKR